MKKSQYNAEYMFFIFPAFLLFCIFFIVPFFSGFYYSLTDWNGIAVNPTFVGLKNYIRIFEKDKPFWSAFLTTLKYAAGHVFFVNLLAFVLAVILTKPIIFNKTLRVFFFLPNVLSLVIVGQIWSFLFGEASGELGRITGISFFSIGWLSNPDIAIYSVIIASIWQSAGWFMLIYISGLEAIPMEIIEASKMDGVKGLKTYTTVILPLIVPSITVSLFLTLINSLRVFDIVYAMTQGGPGYATQTVILNIYYTTFNSSLYGYGTAKSMILVLAIFTVSFFQVYFLKKKEVSY